jgi:hypothetical protein
MPANFAVGRHSLPFSGEVIPAAVYAATQNSIDLGNLGAAGLIVVIDVTAVPGTDTVTFTIQGKDKVSGKYYTLLASTALVATGTVRLRVHPDLTAAANAAASDLVPDAWRVLATHSAATNFTYSVGACLTP